MLWELCMRLQEVTLREVELSPSRVLRVFEHTELADCAGALRQLKARAHAVAVTALLTALLTRCGAGAVVWDAALVLVHYLAKGTRAVSCTAACILGGDWRQWFALGILHVRSCRGVLYALH